MLIFGKFRYQRLQKLCRNFDKEIYGIKKKLLKVDKIESVEDDYIIPPRFFDIAKSVIIIEDSFCNKDEVFSKQFMRQFHNFTGSKFDLQVKWITRKTKALLN